MLVIENVNAHRRQKWPLRGFVCRQAEARRVDPHRFELVAFWLFLKLDDLAAFVRFKQAEFAGVLLPRAERRISSGRPLSRDDDRGTCDNPSDIDDRRTRSATTLHCQSRR